MKLHNAAAPSLWTARPGGEAEPPYVGKVIARLVHNELHPFAVWSISSDDGFAWHCVQGDYCETLAMARTAFAARRI